MTGFDTSRLSPEVAAYIRSLETRVAATGPVLGISGQL